MKLRLARKVFGRDLLACAGFGPELGWKPDTIHAAWSKVWRLTRRRFKP